MPPTPPAQKMGDLHEAHLAIVFSGARTRASGSVWFDPADGRNHHDIPFAFAWDGKSTKGKTISVTLDMLAKIRQQAIGDRPAIGLRWYANELLDKVAEDWIAVPGADFEELLEGARRLAALEAEHGSLADFLASPVLIIRLDQDVPPERLEAFRGELEAIVRAGGIPQHAAEEAAEPDLVTRLREEASEAGRQLALAREELDRYRSGRVIPPYVPSLPWTVVFQVHLPGHVETSGMHYDADGAVTQFAVSEIRVERHMGDRPRLIVNNALVTDGDLYVDGTLRVRAWRVNKDGEKG